jgi:hypothetical protein
MCESNTFLLSASKPHEQQRTRVLLDPPREKN